MRDYFRHIGVRVADGPGGVVMIGGGGSAGLLSEASDKVSADIDKVAKGSLSAPGSDSLMRVYSLARRNAAAVTFAEGLGKAVVLTDGAIAFTGTERAHDAFRTLLEVFDQPVRAFRVRVALVEYRAGDSSSLGFHAALDALGLVVRTSANPGSLVPQLAVTAGRFSAVLSSVGSDDRFEVIQTGSVVVGSGKSGRVSVGAEVPVLAATTSSQGVVTQNVQYKSAGVVVEVAPQLEGENVVGRVSAELSNVIRTQTSGIDSPTVNKRSVSSEIAARLGEVLILGGLDERRKDLTIQRFLGFPVGTSNSSAVSTILVLLSFELV